MADTNPITLVFDALWTILEAHAPLAALVKTGNRVKFTKSTEDPIKRNAQIDDYPEVRVVPAGGGFIRRHDSAASMLIKRFRIEMYTGEQQAALANDTSPHLFNVEWEILRAMVDWEATMNSLLFNSKAFVKHCEVNEFDERLEVERQTRAWRSVWQGEVWLAFDTSDL